LVGTLAAVVAFDFLSGIIALLVSYYAFQARRFVESSVLSAFSFGFLLLAAGLLVEAIITLSVGRTVADATRLEAIELFENLVYLVLQVIAFAAIAIGYARVAYGGKSAGTLTAAAASGPVVASRSRIAELVGLTLAFYYTFIALQSIILVLLVFVIFEGFLVYTRGRDASSLLVLLGFALIFVAHVVVLNSVLEVSGAQYAAGAAIQFLGFLSLLAFVIRSGRIGSA
jgi:hypothetical protein